jgi:hypothetical protein
LENEKERKLAIQREQKLKQENIAIEAEFLKEKRERVELERIVEAQSFKRLSRKDFEKRSNKSLSSTKFKSNFSYSSEKTYDSMIDDHLSESQKETLVRYSNEIINKKRKTLPVKSYENSDSNEAEINNFRIQAKDLKILDENSSKDNDSNHIEENKSNDSENKI